MEMRKIIKFGKSSYVITLPQKWVEENKLDKGDPVHISEKEDSLIISLNNSLKHKNAVIKIDDKPLKLINKELISYYLKNYNEIFLEGNNILERLDELKVFKEKLSSVEFTHIGRDRIVLRDLTAPANLSLRKLTSEIIEMVKVLLDNLVHDDKKKVFRMVSELDVNINKLSFLAFKAINYNLCHWEKPNEMKNAIHSWRIISALETCGDIIKRISRYIKNESYDGKNDVSITVNQLKQYFDFVTNLLDKNVNIDQNLNLYLDKKQSILREIEDLKGKIQDNLNLSLVISQLFKDIVGQLDQILLSIIDIRLE